MNSNLPFLEESPIYEEQEYSPPSEDDDLVVFMDFPEEWMWEE